MFSEKYSLIIILPVLDFTTFFRFILAWGKFWRTWCTFWSTCRRKFLYLAKNYLNIFVTASNQLAVRIEVHFFSFAMWNERTLVTCKSCEARSAFQRFTRDQCPCISQCKRIKVYFNPYIYAKAIKKTLKVEKSRSIFRHVTSAFHRKILATNFLCFIVGERHGSVILQWQKDSVQLWYIMRYF